MYISAALITFMLEAFRGTPPPDNGTTAVSGTFTVVGTYCVPDDLSKNTLQILVHGITYGKDYWTGLGFGDEFDWHVAANACGYATLIPQLNIDTFHYLLNSVRTFPANPLGRTFSKLVWVGHSYGSFLGSTLARQFPSDADALVITGFSTAGNFSGVLTAHWTAAAHHAPALANLPAGYLTRATEANRTAVFYAGAFDPALPPFDFRVEGTITVGEAAAIPVLPEAAPAYTGPVFIATGAQGVFFCGTIQADCDAKLAASKHDFFPAVADRDFGFFAPDQTGHDLRLHLSAPLTSGKVHDFLDAHL
ncbi:hypothetical protein B0T24DRAFT_660629 [Lasiosphaeria ovina]|uniref:AB hydrolase-1 domain-containing protein n=1 Tax=Lasiosphaeria ovina TaxID=92902 RepID=A0AAE0JSK8_9PEZI|nr:hypothetical protein B0T24DRAFT_660629 [Lasiosphaeria ovina]